MQRIPAVIIQTPNSKRFEPLLESLRGSQILEPILLPAVMGKSLPRAADSVAHEEVARFGRELTQNERACAISHSKARTIIAASKHGGLVFEDDARITHLANLEATVSNFLSKAYPSIRALGLLHYGKTSTSPDLVFNEPKFHRLLAEAPLAVATVLTPGAAESLLESATKTSQIADWPHSRCKFYITSVGLVLHGDADTGSVIGETSARVYASSPQIYTVSGFLSSYRRLRQKIDTYLVRYYQSK